MDAAQRSRRQRQKLIGAAITAAMVVVYVVVVLTYQSSINVSFTEPTPRSDGVAIVLVADQLQPVERQVQAAVLLFPGSDLLDESGRLTTSVVVNAYPAVGDSEVTFPMGRVPAPKNIVLPASGVVQEYPFDRYQLSTTVQVRSGSESNAEQPTEASVFVQLPGWTLRDVTVIPAQTDTRLISGTFARDFSTIGIALLFLSLMVIIAFLVVRVVRSVSLGHMELSLVVASWITALLFALVPLRGALPGSPPLGSWIDILVYFWVVAIVMVSLALVTSLLLSRARPRP